MKSIVIGGAVALPFLAKALFSQAVMDGNLLTFAKDIGFAGLVFYLIAYTLPKQGKLHAEERRFWFEASNEAREKHEAAIQKITHEHREASDAGHAAARTLADRISEIKAHLEK